MKPYKNYRCKYCGKELYGVDPICFYSKHSTKGKVCGYVCSSCKQKLRKGKHTFGAYTSYSGLRKYRH